MNIVNTFKEKIGFEEIKLLSDFLGENENALAKSTELSMTSLVQGLIRHGESESGLSDIMNVIKDGGHSGDILDDPRGLFTNQDKTQLLITIGNNINNHFFGNTGTAISDKVAELGGIKKTSAASLFSLCSPLILGLMGKQVKSQNMSQVELNNLLQDQKETVKSQLPPAINTVYDQLSVDTPKENKPSKINSDRSSNLNFGTVAWILLAALVLAAAYYSLRGNSTMKINPFEKNMSVTDSTMSIEIDSNEVKKIEPVNEIQEQEKVIPETQSNNDVVLDSENINSNQGNVLGLLQKSNSWVSFSANNFKGQTAELRSNSELNTLASYLKNNPNKSLIVAGIGLSRNQEDRAYAIQGKLYEMGVPLSQIQLTDAPNSSTSQVKIKLQ